MSIFSEKLKYYMDKKNAAIYPMAKYCNVDRSNLYKYIRGDRFPPCIQIVENISNYLMLDLCEKDSLLEAYQITEIGDSIYFQRKYVVEFIESLNISGLNIQELEDLPQNTRYLPSELTIYGKRNINKVIRQMLRVLPTSLENKICLICQPEYEFLYDLISVLCEKSKFHIEHIICMENTDCYVDYNKYNLQSLAKLAPLFIADCEYQIYYYYANINSHFHNINLFPYVICTEYAVLQFTADLEYGLYLSEASIVEMFYGIFESYKCKTMPLILFNPNINDICERQGSIKKGPGTNYTISTQPCLGNLLDPKELIRFLKKDIENNLEIRKSLEDNLVQGESICPIDSLHSFFSKEGIRDLLVNGHMVDLTEQYYEDISPEFHWKMICKLYQSILEGTFHGYLINSQLLHMQRDFYMSIFHNEVVSCCFKKKNGTWGTFTINERSLSESFVHFAEYLHKSDFVMSKEEMLRFLKNILEETKKVDHKS